jgi:hypothetical protein
MTGKIMSAVLVTIGVLTVFFSAYIQGLVNGREENAEEMHQIRMALIKCNDTVDLDTGDRIVFDPGSDIGGLYLYGDTIQLCEDGRVIKAWIDGVLVYDSENDSDKNMACK